MVKQVAEQLVDELSAAGIDRIYAVAGDSLNRVNDAVRRSEGAVKWIHVRHEETGAFAAGAEAQLLDRPACCAGSSGPGHVHLINGLYDAHRSGVPVLAIASTIASGDFGTRYFQETDPIRLFDDCSCYNQVATTPAQFPRMLQAALQHAVERRGVSVLGLPGDLAGKPAATPLTSQRMFTPQPKVVPSDEELAELAALLNGSEKITIYCGIGARAAHDELVELSARLQAPVAYSFKSKMEIQYDNPREVGLTGLLGVASGYDSMHEADVLLMLGTDFPYAAFIPQNNRIVQVDIDPARLGRRARLEMGLCGDIKATLTALLPQIEPKKNDAFLKRQLDGYSRVRSDLERVARRRGESGKIAPEYAISRIDALADFDAVFTVDTGMTCVWGARYLRATGKRKMLGSFNHGSMANAMPQAIGAALACPGRQVVALCGDGGLSMLLGDLMTIVQYRLPVKTLVFDNRALGMVKLEMEVAGLPDCQTDMQNPDFAGIARAMGMKGYRVEDPDELESVLEKAFREEGPVLVDMMTDPNALAMPPKVEWEQMTGFAKAMYRLLAGGRGTEVVDTIRSNYNHLREVL